MFGHHRQQMGLVMLHLQSPRWKGLAEVFGVGTGAVAPVAITHNPPWSDGVAPHPGAASALEMLGTAATGEITKIGAQHPMRLQL